MLVEIQSFCVICVWTPPPGRFDAFSGYDVRYFIPETGEELIVNTEESEFFQLTTPETFALGPAAQIMVQVSQMLRLWCHICTSCFF